MVQRYAPKQNATGRGPERALRSSSLTPGAFKSIYVPLRAPLRKGKNSVERKKKKRRSSGDGETKGGSHG